MEVAPLRFAAGQHHTLTHCLLSGHCSELFKNTLCLVLLLVAGSVFSQTTAFITTWKTDNPGTSNSTSITIPTTGSGYRYDADWNNDGTFEQTGITGAVTHNFGVAGTYTVRIRGTFPRIFFNDGGDRRKLLNVNQWGTGAWTSMLSAFWGCSNLSITATDVPNLSGVTNTANMFASCTSLNGPANIGTWNMATVTDIRSMFHTASAFNQPIGTWNTGAVTLASTVFFNAAAFNQPLGTWNTAAMTTMAGMFSGATAFNQPLGTWTLNAAVNLTTMLNNCGMDCAHYSATLIGWRNNPATPNGRSLGASGRKFETPAVAARTFLDVTKAWTFTGDAITTAFFADADGDGFGNAAVSINACSAPSGFVSNSTDCNDANPNIKPGAIEICNGIDDDCNGTIDPGFTCMAPFITTWRTDNNLDASGLTSITIPTTGTGYNYEVDWNNDGIYEQTGITGSVTHDFGVAGTYTIRLRGNFPRIFFNNGGDCQKLLDIPQWGGIAWTSMNSAFFGCINLDITATDVPNLSGVTNMAQMFRSCILLTGPANMGTWNTATVTDMGFMFRDANEFNQPIGTWNTGLVTNMAGMFSGADVFNQPIGNWNTANVTNMESMFDAADVFNQPIGNWNTAKVTNMKLMFSGANNFNQPIGNWNTAKVTNMQFMFVASSIFNQPIGNWNTVNVTNMQFMFSEAAAFNQPIGTWTLNAAVNLTGLLDNCGMDCANYSATLVGWSSNPATPNGRSLGASGRKFETNAVAARTNLDITKAWTFTGDALVSPAFFADADGDGFGDAAVSINVCSQPSGFVTNSTDCNDADANINPGMAEIKCNGIDDNCNGPNDELFTLFADVDGDGFGNSAVAQIGCPPIPGFVINNGDCDDSDPTNNPNTTGFCSTMKYDEGDSEPGFEFSGWNFGSTSPGGIFPANASINGIETIAHSDQCWNAISVEVTRFCNFNNLNLCHTGTWRIHSNLDPVGVTFTILETTSATQVITLNFEHINTLFLKLIDPGSTNRHSLVWDNLKYKLPNYPTLFADADGDGFGDPNVSQNTCSAGNGFVANSSDCDDTNANINPNATEICNGIDDDCDGQMDESGVQVPWFADADGDGFGNAAVSQIWCTPPASSGFVLNSSDCDDTNANIHPNATEITCNGIDDNCNGPNDEQPTYFADADGDGFGNAAVSQNACSQPSGFVANSTDCDDTNANIHPNATEIKCNGMDDNCNGPNDESFTFFADADGDGFGNAAVSQNACSAPSGFVANSTDCDDTDANIHPNATEVTCNGVDDNCNGSNDEETTYFADADGDGFGDAAVSQNACAAPSGFVANSTDCDDTNANIHPNAIEICNGMDDDCDGQTDENVQPTFFADADGDGFGNAAVSQNSCAQPSGFVSNSTDCDDTDANIHPNATEICNEIDDNCDGQIDENLLFTFFADADGDGFGDATVSQSTCSQPSGFVSNSTDCNDANANANPNATEICNGMDDDCDGQIDENVQLTFFADADGDGFGNAAVSQNACSQPSGFVANSTDCNDANANIHPGATEICNEMDDDCNGIVDDGTVCTEPFITTWKTDNPGTSNSSSITIPTTGSGYNYDVDWDNDGTFEETGLTGNVTHDFGEAGTYTIRIRGTFPRIVFNNSGDRQKLLDISRWGDIAWTSMSRAFFGCSNLDITATDVPNLSGVTSMSVMFAGCSMLNGPANIGNWNTANVTDMSFMFSEATSFNQPIGNWNTEKVTDMRQMFNVALAFNQSLGIWRLNVVDDLLFMLTNCGMDCTNYSATLIGWNNSPATPNGRSLGANGRTYETNATAARTNLIAVKGWTITGDALAPVTTAAAGPNEAICSLTTTLAGNTPVIGTGTWTQVSGPGTANFADVNAPNTSVTASVPGTYTLRWTINAPCAASSDDVVITFAANPTAAAAGDDQTSAATCGQTQVTLAANAPTVGTGMWSIQSGTGGSFGDASSPTSTFSGNAGATYTLRWTVTNAPCAASTDEMTVTFNQAPSFATCPPGVTVSVTSGCSATATYTAAAANATPSASVTYAFGGATTGSGSGTGSGSAFNLGTTTVNLIATNSCGNSNCSFNVVVQAAEINVQGNGMSIVDGDVTPSTSNHTDFGQTTGPNIVRTFTVQNTGSANLNVTGITLGGANPDQFSIGALTPPSPILAGQSATFTVTYATSVVAVHSATVNIASGDCDEANYDFAIRGELTCTAPTFTSCPSAPVTANTTTGFCNAPVTYSVMANGTPDPALTYVFTGATTGSSSGTGSGSTFNKGNTTVTVTATNPCGAPTCVFTVTVSDLEKPTLAGCPSNILLKTNDDGGADCTVMVNYTAPTFSDNCDGTGTATLQSGPASGTSLNVSGSPYTVVYTKTDVAGNAVLTNCSFMVTVQDNTKPTLAGCPSNILLKTNDDGGADCAVMVNYTAPTFSDNCDGTGTATLQSGPASGTSLNVSGSPYTVVYTKTDVAGNAVLTNCSFMVTVQDNTPPSITCPANIAKTTDAGQCTAVTTYTVTASDNCAFTLTRTNGFASGTAFPPGFNVVNWQVTDAGGNSAICSFTVTVTDGQNPTITCPGNIAKSTDANQCTAVVTYPNPIFSDNCAGGYLTRTSGPASGGVFPKGTTMVNWVATDASGNSSLCGFTVTVNDAQAPTITCPANQTKNTDAGQCTAVATYTTPLFTDNCTGATGVLFSGGASGSAFQKGANSVVWQATDAAGLTARCTFTITVNDNQAPVITCPGNQTKNTDAGLCTAVATYPAPTFTDNCTGGNVTLQSGLASGSAFPKGLNTVVWRATDAAGLTKTCTFRVTVNDTQAPTITCPANQAKTTDANVCTAVAIYNLATFTDNCPGGSMVKLSGLNSGAAFPKGTSQVLFKATDAAGNQSLCTMTITVTDAQLPTVACPANMVVTGTTANGVCSALVTYTNPAASDNCSLQSNFLLSGLVSGSVFPSGVTTNVWRATDEGGLTATCAFTVTVGCGTGSSLKFEVRSSKLEVPAIEHEYSVNMRLAPNPATTEVMISIEGLTESGGTISVFDAQGRVVGQQFNVGSPTASLNVSDLPSGLYQVRLQTEHGVVTKGLVVSRL